MPIIQQTEPSSRPKTRTRSIQVFPSDEIADFQGCTAEEIGLLMQLRWHAWYHGGIENTEDNLFRLRKSFGVSAQKFKKKTRFFVEVFYRNRRFFVLYGRREATAWSRATFF